MKKFILQLLLFFLVFTAIFVTVEQFDNTGRRYNINPNIQKLVCMDAFDSLDILFVGNSYCYSAINPAFFDSAGIRTFNLGVSSSGVNYYSVLVHDYMATARKKPKSVFILVSPFTFSGKADDSHNNPIYRFVNHPISNEQYILDYSHSQAKKYPVMAARSFSRTFVSLYTMFKGGKDFAVRENNPMYLSKGFIASSEINTPENEAKTLHFYQAYAKDSFDLAKVNKLLALADELEKQDVEVVFFEVPSNKLYSFFNADYLAGYQKFLKDLQQHYLFLPVKMEFDQSYYRDLDHVNVKGASLVSPALIRQIMQHEKLTGLFFGKKAGPVL